MAVSWHLTSAAHTGESDGVGGFESCSLDESLSGGLVLLQVGSMTTIHVPLRSPYFCLLLVVLCLIRLVGKETSFLHLSDCSLKGQNADFEEPSGCSRYCVGSCFWRSLRKGAGHESLQMSFKRHIWGDIAGANEGMTYLLYIFLFFNVEILGAPCRRYSPSQRGFRVLK